MLALLWACGGPRVLEVSIRDGQVAVDGVAAVPIGEVDQWPLDADLPQLAAALAPREPQPLTLSAAAQDPWYRIRTVFLTVREAGFGSVTFRADGLTAGPTRALPSRGAPGCLAPVTAHGSRPTVRIDLYGDPKEAWVQLSARFHPVVGGVVDELPIACWAGPGCDAVYPEGPLRTACVAGATDGAVDRVTLGGPTGCAAPVATAGSDASWAAALTATLKGLGLGPEHTVHISPEPRIPFARFLEAARAVEAAGLPFPHVPDAMVQGNDGPPPCDAAVRDAEALAVATARWYGANHLRD